MEFQELIQARRSIRKFGASVKKEDLEAILRDAQQAPSWKNSQTSRCYAVVTPETLEALRADALPSFNRNSSAGAYSTAAVDRGAPQALQGRRPG